MPLYPYRCEKCGKELEIIQKLDDPPPECCDVPMKREMGLSSFRLKGSGWAIDGYSSKGKK